MNAACHAALQAAHTSQEMHTKCGACPHRIAVAATRFGCKQEAPSRVGLVHPTTCRLCKAGRQDGIRRPILCLAGVSGSYGCRQHCAGWRRDTAGRSASEVLHAWRTMYTFTKGLLMHCACCDSCTRDRTASQVACICGHGDIRCVHGNTVMHREVVCGQWPANGAALNGCLQYLSCAGGWTNHPGAGPQGRRQEGGC